MSVWVHMNNCYPKGYKYRSYRKMPAFAVEVALVNRKIIKLNSDKRSFDLIKNEDGYNLYGCIRCEMTD